MTLSDRVMKLRKVRGLSQSNLAELCKVPHSTIFRIESGEVKEPTPEVLKKLAEHLGTTVDYVVGRTDHVTPAEVISSDKKVEELVRSFNALSEADRNEVLEFTRWRQRRAEDEAMRNNKYRKINAPRSKTT